MLSSIPLHGKVYCSGFCSSSCNSSSCYRNSPIFSCESNGAGVDLLPVHLAPFLTAANVSQPSASPLASATSVQAAPSTPASTQHRPAPSIQEARQKCFTCRACISTHLLRSRSQAAPTLVRVASTVYEVFSLMTFSSQIARIHATAVNASYIIKACSTTHSVTKCSLDQLGELLTPSEFWMLGHDLVRSRCFVAFVGADHCASSIAQSQQEIRLAMGAAGDPKSVKISEIEDLIHRKKISRVTVNAAVGASQFPYEVAAAVMLHVQLPPNYFWREASSGNITLLRS